MSRCITWGLRSSASIRLNPGRYRNRILIGVSVLVITSACSAGIGNNAASHIMGTTSVGSITDTGNGHGITCNRYGSTESGVISTMSVNVGNVDPADKAFSLAIYSDLNANPSSLLGRATGVLTANSWNTLRLSAPVTAGGLYWLCYNSSTANSAYNNMRNTSGNARAVYKTQSYGTWPASFGIVANRWTANYSIYATFGSSTTPPTSTATVKINPIQVISRSVPSFASSGTASNANDADYNTTWNSTSSSAWLTYNLANVPVAQRSHVLLVWYNEATVAFDPSLAQESPVGVPENYTVETNAAPGATTPPATGWTALITVAGNKYHSRQHVLDMRGADWIRLNVTAARGDYSSINMDVYDASKGLSDDWIIYGSSTPSMAMSHAVKGETPQSFSQMVNEVQPQYFPVQENGSISGLETSDGVKNINTWLSLFPGKYVVLAFGANDAERCVDPTVFHANYVALLNSVISAGKIPVVPTFNWSKLQGVSNCGPALIKEIENLYVDYPEVVKGPDFWTYFMTHPELISSDNTHPTDIGLGLYRELWAKAMLANVYK